MKTILIFLCLTLSLSHISWINANFTQDCESQVCLSRCCPEGKRGTPSLDCVASDPTQEENAVLFGYPGLKSDRFSFLPRDDKYSCKSSNSLWKKESKEEANFTILDNGTILGEYPTFGNWSNTTVFPTHPEEYCVADHDFFWYCLPFTQTSTESFREQAYPVFQVISSVFAIITLIIYYKDESLGSSLFGKMVMLFLANFAGSYLVLAFRDIPLHLPTLCTILGYLSQYSLLTMLFWMNALAFRVYITFRKIAMPSSSNNGKRLAYYCLYAQGAPLIVCAITALVDASGTSQELRPNMGQYRCFLSCHSGITCSHTDSSQLSHRYITPMFIYFGSIQMLINIVNLVLFILTIYHLVKKWKDESKVQSTKSNNNRQNFFVLLKISLLVGLPWILELVSGLDFSTEDYFALNFIIDLPNLLLGFLLFLALVGKKEFQKIKKKFCTPETDMASSASNTTDTSSNASTTPQTANTSV